MKPNPAPTLVTILLLTLPAHAQVPQPDPLRLDPMIAPFTQALKLELDPASHGYSGVARVELQFRIATNKFRFHSQDINLGKAMLDAQELTLTPEKGGIVSAIAAEPVTAGLHTFEVAFTNDFNRDGTGLYKAVSGGRPYLFTKFEPVDARRAFPCWDEPGFKIPWLLSVSVPMDMEVVGNMPIAQTTPAGTQKLVEFGRTPPMPSYLVALAVGPFDFFPIAGQPVPGRIVTVAGKTPLAKLAAQEAPALLAGLERYFGLPHPYPKLDHLAVPEFNSGAMENVGAITYRDSLFLLDSSSVSYQQRRLLLELLTHEMAHMWFGNLVTMEWWDDLWLNEAFATWISFKVAGQFHPDLHFELLSYRNITRARRTDTQPSVKPIRRPFRGGDNLREAFDSLSYNKGQAILGMVEGWIGEENFRAALRRYFIRHSWGNTRAEDLWSAFAESGDDSLRETLRRYIEQPGLPELRFTRLPGDRCEVRQQRYRTMTGRGASDQSWHVPIVIRYGGKAGVKTARLLLKNEHDVILAPGLDEADWIYPNANESSYYTWSLAPELTAALTHRASPFLTTTERLGLLRAAGFAVMAGTTPADERLLLALGFAHDPEPEVKVEVVESLRDLYTHFDPSDRPAYSRLLRGTLRPMLDELGFDPKAGEPARLEPLRGILLLTLGILGDDPEVVAFCRQAAIRQFADARSVRAAIADVTLEVGTWHGDVEWSARLRAAFEKAAEPDVRARFLGALTAYRDPALVRSGLDYALTEAVRPTEIRRILGGLPELASARFDWLTTNYQAVKAKLAEQFLPYLTVVLNGADAALLAKGRAFFLDPARKTPLTELELTKVTESAELDIALRESNASKLAKVVDQLAAKSGQSVGQP